jgi:hypothetical protein
MGWEISTATDELWHNLRARTSMRSYHVLGDTDREALSVTLDEAPTKPSTHAPKHWTSRLRSEKVA